MGSACSYREFDDPAPTNSNIRGPSRAESAVVLATGAVIMFIAVLYFFVHGQTYVHIDAIAHVNKARGIFDNFTPGLKQLGSIWLPLPHILVAPLAWFDVLWATGLAGSILSAICFVGTGWFLFASATRCAGTRIAGWLAFLFFAFNPRIVYLFTTPMTEPLMILCASGLVYFLICWIQTERWQPLALAALTALGGTLTRYEGWAIGAASVALVFAAARRQRWVTTLLYAASVCLGPLLWMLYNLAYFDDPLMFTYGPGSARDYAAEHFFSTGKAFVTAGSWTQSLSTYFIDVAYCVNPLILWLAIAGVVLYGLSSSPAEWRLKSTLLVLAAAPFAFYVYSLYSNTVPILMPGLVRSEPVSIFNVRYGTIMVATLPIYAAVALNFVFCRAGTRRKLSFLMLVPLMFPDPTPEASRESIAGQFTNNLFYTE